MMNIGKYSVQIAYMFCYIFPFHIVSEREQHASSAVNHYLVWAWKKEQFFARFSLRENTCISSFIFLPAKQTHQHSPYDLIIVCLGNNDRRRGRDDDVLQNLL